MGRFWKKHKEKFWAPFEVLMLLAALLAPVFFSDHSSLKSAFFKNFLLSTDLIEFEFSSVKRSIASTIVEIRPPELQTVSSSIVTDRQMRFESLMDDRWQILQIDREVPELGTWEQIPLIFDKERSTSVSTFIELVPGNNNFRVKYRDENGKAKELTMVVNHVRKGTQD